MKSKTLSALQGILVLAVLLTGYYFGKYQEARKYKTWPAEVEETVETTSSTTAYNAPKPVSELGLGTQTFALPRYYFIGSAGGIARQQSTSSYTDTKSTNEINASPDIIGNAYGCVVGEADSTVVELPIIQRHYAEKDYDAWVSGPVDPRIDSIRVYSTTNIVTRREYKPPARWHIGVTAGYGCTPRGLEPYIGIGITYSIFSF